MWRNEITSSTPILSKTQFTSIHGCTACVISLLRMRRYGLRLTPRGRDSLEFGGVGRALLRCRADPKNPGLDRLTIGVQVWRKDLIVGLLRAAGVVRSWRDRPTDRWSYRSVGITWLETLAWLDIFVRRKENLLRDVQAWKSIINGENVYVF